MTQGARTDTRTGAVILGATLIDPAIAEPIEHSAVVIDADGRISDVGRAAWVRFPAGAIRIDAAGLTLVPGLVDCHAHIAKLGTWRDGRDWPTPTGMIVEQLKAGERWVGHGVTTVRDAWGATAGLRKAFSSGSYPGPRLQISTGPVWSSAVSLHGSPTGALFPSSAQMPMDTADGVDDVRRAARVRVAAGADWLKVRAGGWTLDPERHPPTTEYAVEELRAVVEEATAAQIRGVMAHTQGPDSIRNALEAGIRSIEHGDLIDEATAALMQQHGAVLSVQGPKCRPADGEAARYWDQQVQRVTAAVEAGVRIVLGSDALGDEYPHAVIAHLSRCGLGARGALQAATLDGARLLGLDHETGSIEVGKSADLFLLDGDPIREPDVWREPDRVVFSMLRGRVMADRR